MGFDGSNSEDVFIAREAGWPCHSLHDCLTDDRFFYMLFAILKNKWSRVQSKNDLKYRDGKKKKDLTLFLQLKLLHVRGLRSSTGTSRLINSFKQPWLATDSQRGHCESDSSDMYIFSCTSLNDLRCAQKERLTSTKKQACIWSFAFSLVILLLQGH